MEFTKENWENAPEGATLEWSENIAKWADAHLVGFRKTGEPVVEASGDVRVITHNDRLRIILPKRKVTVQLWQNPKAGSLLPTILEADTWKPHSGWTLVGEHIFEVEGE